MSFLFSPLVFVLVCSVLLSALPPALVHGKDLDPTKFASTVLDDDRVWLVEFYSSICGGCQEFASTWGRIETYYSKSSDGVIAAGKINIDKKEGLKVAEELGVLDDGVPHVRLFTKKGDKTGSVVVKSDSAFDYKKITDKINKMSHGLKKKKDGHFSKEL